MSDVKRAGAVFVASIAAVAAGCGGGPGPRAVGSAAMEAAPVAESERVLPREPDVPPRERWAAPFAVSATGAVEPLTPREIVVIGADPTIAAGLEEQAVIAARLRADAGTAGAGRLLHRVVPGETLTAIADRYGVSSEAIRQANNLDGDRLPVGRELIIPAGD